MLDEVTMFVPTDRHRMVLEQTLKELSRPAEDLFHDVSTAVITREHGVGETVTADKDLLQFRFLEVTNPLLPN